VPVLESPFVPLAPIDDPVHEARVGKVSIVERVLAGELLQMGVPTLLERFEDGLVQLRQTCRRVSRQQDVRRLELKDFAERHAICARRIGLLRTEVKIQAGRSSRRASAIS
jgi:hypothetical protein